jgi:hypothetical protein
MAQVMIDGQMADADPALQAAMAADAVSAPVKVYTRRIHIFERATKDECALLAARLAAAEDQLAQIFSAADWIDHDNPWFPELRSEISAAVGSDRAEVLLAASPYPQA